MLDHPLILIIIAVAALVRWLWQRSNEATQEPERPNVGDEPIPRGNETQTEEDRIRRFLEALGQPAGSKPPPKVTPKRPRPPRVFQPLPPLTTVPPAEPVTSEAVIQAPPPLPIELPAFTPFTPAPVLEAAFEVRDFGTKVQESSPRERRPVADHQNLLSRLRSPQDLRNAIVLREIFGPPRSLQDVKPL